MASTLNALDRVLVASHDISVVICAHSSDRWNDLVAAIASVRRQNVPPHEIVVVVDHNQDLLTQVRTDAPDIVAVENRGPQGLSGARNTGIATATGAIVAFLDDDALAMPDWLEHIGAGYEDARVLGVGGAIEPSWRGGRPTWFPQEFDWVVGCTFKGMPETTTSVQRLIGCNMSFRRDVFDGIGTFRHEIGRVGARPTAGEETELCIRARQRWRGKVFLYEPRARVSHQVPSARACWRYYRARCYGEGLSKALIARFVGAQDGLATDRAYTLRTLPRGVARGLADAVLHGDSAGLARAGAIVAGLTITMAGYATETASFTLRKRRPDAERRAGERDAWPARVPPRVEAVQAGPIDRVSEAL